MNAAWPRRVSLIIAGGLPAIPTPTIGAPTGDRPAASGFAPAPTGFAFHSQARPATPTESSSRRTASGPPYVSDWSFSFHCSPPRLAATRLRFDTARLFGRTGADFHRSVPSPSQAHECARPRAQEGEEGSDWRSQRSLQVSECICGRGQPHSVVATSCLTRSPLPV